MISPEWAAAITGIVVGVVSGGISGGAMLIKMGRGQGAAKVRNDQIDASLAEIKGDVKDTKADVALLKNGESKCKLAFEKRITRIQGILGINDEGAEVHGHARASDPPLREMTK